MDLFIETLRFILNPRLTEAVGIISLVAAAVLYALYAWAHHR